ncbi:hypothetical protein ASPZODRAFT_147373 [Penicilliopsis zonata CBS 506.65]|uniref:Glycoside hydrolase family 3 N-terminal domain-containing protein n=1 Tax=Penicilliopsis zonata CBS 506.65 TaxID=1073090 RepID=A0A1L9S5H7_9EURO|nr:hypothetical protein ASPZODRAFT_147373 [Penicilliopsis zonata CBS 506.65]OJJ42387.1 hypothetical protein ASPZODRAFT_147373 [Penicilliopsis zonata CBS 506.65]
MPYNILHPVSISPYVASHLSTIYESTDYRQQIHSISHILHIMSSLECLQKNGFVVIRLILSPEEINTLQTAALKAIKRTRAGEWPYLRSSLIQDHHVGAIALQARNLLDAPQAIQLIQSLQNLAYAAGHKPPLLISLDQENGAVNSIGDDNYLRQFPSAMGLAACNDPRLTRVPPSWRV